MFSKYLSNINDVSGFAIIAFILFFTLFLFVLAWVLTTNKKYFDKLGQIPFDENELKSIKDEIKL
jgi:cbb3-type cytochrome oxidase subunit 3